MGSKNVSLVCIAAHSRPSKDTSQSVCHACLHRSPRHCVFLRAYCQLLNIFAGAITSLSIGVVGNCFIGLLIGLALQLARVHSFSELVIPTDT